MIGPAVQLRDEDGGPRGDIYQLNGVERGQVSTARMRRAYGLYPNLPEGRQVHTGLGDEVMHSSETQF